jgi:hypothetical protein
LLLTIAEIGDATRIGTEEMIGMGIDVGIAMSGLKGKTIAGIGIEKERRRRIRRGRSLRLWKKWPNVIPQKKTVLPNRRLGIQSVRNTTTKMKLPQSATRRTNTDLMTVPVTKRTRKRRRRRVTRARR